MKSCKWCGKKFPNDKGEYCSDECRVKLTETRYFKCKREEYSNLMSAAYGHRPSQSMVQNRYGWHWPDFDDLPKTAEQPTKPGIYRLTEGGEWIELEEFKEEEDES